MYRIAHLKHKSHVHCPYYKNPYQHGFITFQNLPPLKIKTKRTRDSLYFRSRLRMKVYNQSRIFSESLYLFPGPNLILDIGQTPRNLLRNSIWTVQKSEHRQRAKFSKVHREVSVFAKLPVSASGTIRLRRVQVFVTTSPVRSNNYLSLSEKLSYVLKC